MLPPAQVRPIAATSSDVQLLTGLFVLRGFVLTESTGAAVATAVLRDGTSTSGVAVAPVNLLQGTTFGLWMADTGTLVRTGLYLDMTAGSMAGTVWFTPVTHVDDIDIVTGEHGPYLMRSGT